MSLADLPLEVSTVGNIPSEEERIQRKISQELLTFFNRSDAHDLVEYFDRTPSQTTSDLGYTYDLNKLSPEAQRFLAEEVSGRRIIEFGNKGYKAGYNVPSAKLFELGARSYEGCDPKYDLDALTFLLRQPDESAIVTSFGVLDDGVLYMPGCEVDRLLSKYTAELGKQIYRVTPKRGVTIHGLDSVGDLIRAGFKAESPTRDLDGARGNITVLRKK